MVFIAESAHDYLSQCNEMNFVKQKAENERIKTAEFRVPELFALRSTFLVSITSLTILIFTVGCPPVEPGPPGPPGFKPNEIEPNTMEPKTEPNQIEHKTEPNEPEPKIESKQIEPKVEPNDIKPSPKVRFHNKCAAILTNFVNDKGTVDYKTLKRKKLKLIQLLDEFASLDRKEYNSWPREDKIAFWINAYNIQMLRIIVENYPIKASRWYKLLWPPTSIRHIPPQGVLGAAKWNKYKFLVMDEEFTLVRIQQRFFRQEFDEPRVFLAISHASLSSPPLRNEPYYGHKLDKQLNNQAKRFLSSRRAFRIDRKKQRVYLSAILQPTWHGKEFSGKYSTNKKFKDYEPVTRAVLNFITNYVSKEDVSFLETKNYSIEYIKYDWRLNDSSGRR